MNNFLSRLLTILSCAGLPFLASAEQDAPPAPVPDVSYPRLMNEEFSPTEANDKNPAAYAEIEGFSVASNWVTSSDLIPKPEFHWQQLGGTSVKIWKDDLENSAAELWISHYSHGITQKVSGNLIPGLYMLYWQHQASPQTSPSAEMPNRYFVRVTIGNPADDDSPQSPEKSVEIFRKNFNDTGGSAIAKDLWADQLVIFQLEPKDLAAARTRGLWVSFDVLNPDLKQKTGALLDNIRLFPVILQDLQNLFTPNDDRIIQPTFSIAASDKKSAPAAPAAELDHDIAWIRPHATANQGPEMPNLQITVPNLPKDWSFRAQLFVKYDRIFSGKQPQDQVRVPIKTLMTSYGNTWAIHNDPSWKFAVSEGFFGGNCTLMLYIARPVPNSKPSTLPGLIFPFRICGQNPNPATCQKFISENAQTAWFAPFIARIESKSIPGWVESYSPNYVVLKDRSSLFTQFFPAGYPDAKPSQFVPKTDGFPVLTPPIDSAAAGCGIFNIRGNITDKKALPPRSQLWNWQDNVLAGLAMVNDKSYREAADRYFLKLQQKFPSGFNPGTLPSLYVNNRLFDLRSAIWITTWFNLANDIPDIANYLEFSPNLPPGVSLPDSPPKRQWHWSPPPLRNGKSAIQLIAEEINSIAFP